MKTAYKVHFSRIHAHKSAKNPFGGWLLFSDFSEEMQNWFIEPQQKFPKKHPKCVCKAEGDLAYRNFIKLSGSCCDVVKSFFPTCDRCGIGKASSRISILISLCFSGGSRPSEKKGGSSRP